MQIKKQQLELDMKKQTVSKLGKEHVKAVNYYPPYLTSMQSTSCKMLGWMNYTSWESRFLGEISTTSDIQMIPSYGRKCRGIKEPLDEGKRGE